MKIELTILKEDILLHNYLDSNDCPITRALHRAGYKNLLDGGEIIDKKTKIVVANEKNKSYKNLLKKLFGMYNSVLDKEDKMCMEGETIKEMDIKTFTHILIVQKKLLQNQ